MPRESASAPELARQGRYAFSLGQMGLAAGMLARAAPLMKHGGPGRLELMTKLGSALARTGQLARADAVLTDAIDEAVAIGDQRLASHARVERALWRLWSDPSSESDAHSTAEGALRVFEAQEDEVGLAKAWRLLHDSAASWDEGQESLARALEHARRAGDQRREADALWWVGVYFVFGPMHVEEAIRYCEELLSDAR